MCYKRLPPGENPIAVNNIIIILRAKVQKLVARDLSKPALMQSVRVGCEAQAARYTARTCGSDHSCQSST